MSGDANIQLDNSLYTNSGKIKDVEIAHEVANSINDQVDIKYPQVSPNRERKILSKYAGTQSRALLDKQAARTVEVERLSKIDSLTGLLRQGVFNEAFDRAVENAQKNSMRVILTTFDIDYFKNFNDSNGHQTGDKLLAEFGKNLKHIMRSTDLLGRVGGEEFAAAGVPANEEERQGRVVPRTLSEAFDSGLTIAEKIRTTTPNLEITNINGTIIKGVTISCGLTFSNKDESSDQVRLRADVALYLAKAQGRNCLVVAMPQSNNSSIFYLATPKIGEEISAESRDHFEYRELKIVPNDQLTKIKEIVN